MGLFRTFIKTLVPLALPLREFDCAFYEDNPGEAMGGTSSKQEFGQQALTSKMPQEA